MFEVDWQHLGLILLKLMGAFLLALPVAWEREVKTRIMGLRTFPIVAMATCGYLLIAHDLFPADQAQARALQGVVTGMGFIGGGAILQKKSKVEGTATAASLWATGAVGVAMAYDRLDIGIAISAIIFLALRVLTPMQDWIDTEAEEDPERDGAGDEPGSG